MRTGLKKQLHAARSSLSYWKNTERAIRGISREEGIAQAQAEVDRIAALVAAETPEPVSLRLRSPYFIGPRLKRGKRGDGEAIKCFRCEAVKPRDEFYSKGTVCCECVAKRANEWGEKNPEKRKGSKDKWIAENRETKNAKARDTHRKNPEKNKARARLYQINNREKKNAWTREYLRRRKKDPQYRALLTCKRRMWILFKSVGRKKTLRSAELLGIDRAGFFAHIESLFKPGMTWDNRGKYGWHIDHKKPCALFDMTDDNQARDCWHYTNLQPLWAKENWSKGDRYVEPIKIIDAPENRDVREFATVEQSTA